jgi:hypothetical protein
MLVPRPYDLQVNAENADVPTFASLLLLANKYGYHRMEKWALEILAARLEFGDKKYLTYCGGEMIDKIVHVAVCVGSESIQKKVETEWHQRLKGASTETLSRAMDSAERLGLRTFLAGLYYMVMVSLAERQISPKEQSESTLGTDVLTMEEALTDMSPLHVARIASGYFKLSILGERLLMKVVKLASSSPGKHGYDSVFKVASVPACHILKRVYRALKYYPDPYHSLEAFTGKFKEENSYTSYFFDNET